MNTIQKLRNLAAFCDQVIEMARGDQLIRAATLQNEQSAWTGSGIPDKGDRISVRRAATDLNTLRGYDKAKRAAKNLPPNKSNRGIYKSLVHGRVNTAEGLLDHMWKIRKLRGGK